MKKACESSVLLLAIAGSWVSVAQLARAAEVATLQLQHHTVVPLVTWANSTAWILLAMPYMAMRRSRGAEGCELLATDAFKFIALTTNFSYISALHYLPASLNTAIFSSSPVFTLLLQSVFLPAEAGRSLSPGFGEVRAALCGLKALSVILSVVGVLLITEPWRDSEGDDGLDKRSRILGAGMSLFAALGTSIYQVYFKKVFGDRMKPEEVGRWDWEVCAEPGCVCEARISQRPAACGT
ncbi:unnamed protein product [Effrenium voratum]|nr:unnamed protein product [Effrenium voratum]